MFLTQSVQSTTEEVTSLSGSSTGEDPSNQSTTEKSSSTFSIAPSMIEFIKQNLNWKVNNIFFYLLECPEGEKWSGRRLKMFKFTS